MNNKKLIVGIVGIVVVLSILLVVLLVKGNNNVFVNLGRKTISFVDEKFDEVFKSQKEISKEIDKKSKGNLKMTLEGNLDTTDSSMEEIVKAINGNKFTFEADYDLNKEVIESSVKLKTAKGELNGEFGVDSENAYFRMKDVSEKFFYAKLDENMFEIIKENIDNEDGNKKLKILKDIYDNTKGDILDVIAKQEVTKTNETIEIDGKDKKVTKNTIVLDEKFRDELSLVVLNNLVENDEFLEYYAEEQNKMMKIETETKESIKEELEEQIEELEDSIEELEEKEKDKKKNKDKENDEEEDIDISGTIVFNIYTTKFLNKPIKYEIVNEREGINYTNYMAEKPETIKYKEVISLVVNGKDYEYSNISYKDDEITDKTVISINNNGKGKYDIVGETESHHNSYLSDEEYVTTTKIDGEFEYKDKKSYKLDLDIKNSSSNDDEVTKTKIESNLEFDKFSKKENKGKFEIKLSSDEVEIKGNANWEFKQEEKLKTDFDISVNVDDEKHTIKGDLDIESKDKSNATIEGNINVDNEHKANIKVTIEVNDETDVEKRNLKNQIDVEQMTSEDELIIEQMEQKLIDLGLYEEPEPIYNFEDYDSNVSIYNIY